MEAGRISRVRIYDVAKAAGVSVATASKALNDTGRMTDETRERVKRVATELGFRPNAMARALIGEHRFLEVHVSTPLNVCEGRDPKGLYTLARAGHIPQFTGVSAPYETPESPDFSIDTAHLSLPDACVQVLALLRQRGYIR